MLKNQFLFFCFFFRSLSVSVTLFGWMSFCELYMCSATCIASANINSNLNSHNSRTTYIHTYTVRFQLLICLFNEKFKARCSTRNRDREMFANVCDGTITLAVVKLNKKTPKEKANKNKIWSKKKIKKKLVRTVHSTQSTESTVDSPQPLTALATSSGC